MKSICLSIVCLGATLAATAQAENRPFGIRVVDEATGRGVPLVELRTVHGIRVYTDSAGWAAFDEPGLLGQRVFFYVASHGYEFPPDGFGFRGKALLAEPGGAATLAIKRTNLAERLYRVTGGGIYRESVVLGHPAPVREPLLNGQVVGSDSVVNAVYRGRLYWFWGDTNRPAYPLGNFHVPGAVSELPAQGGLDPAVGVDLRYFVDDNGFAKATCQMPGEGPTWIGGLTVLPDENGRERMFAAYVKVKPPLTVYRRGIAAWSDEQQRFEHVAAFPDEAPVHAASHTFQHEENGIRYVYFCHPYPLTRVAATPTALCDPAQYEAFTCLAEGSRLDAPQLDRDDRGGVRYGWKRRAPAVGPSEQAKFVRQGLLKPQEGWLLLRDRDRGKTVLAQSGSVSWNAYRRRWVLIAVESYGKESFLGEVWYAEADAPTGPWAYAVKIVTHDNYSFYNPKHHPAFDQHGGRVIYFEGTYTHTFSNNPDPTPRYDYNQIMYRLDLSDPRCALPVAVYSAAEADNRRLRVGLPSDGTFDWKSVAFFALDRAGNDAAPIYVASSPASGFRLTREASEVSPDAVPLFFALAPDAADRPPVAVPLYEYVHRETGRREYSLDAALADEALQRAATPLCYVWPNPAR